MKVLGIIPSRYASTRFPGKPLIDLKGKSMIQRVYEGAQKSKLIDTLIVATDDQRIFDEVIRFGGKVEMTDINHATGTDRCAEVCERNSGFDIVINIQGDEPLVDARQLDQLIQALQEETVKIASLATPKISKEELHNPNRIKVVLNEIGNALYFSRNSVPYASEGNLNYPFLRHIGLYGFKVNTLLEITKLNPTQLEKAESLEQLRWLFYGYNIKIVPTEIETPNIDSPEDLELVMNRI